MSEGLVISVHFDKEDHWCWRRGEQILSTLIKNFKLDKISYKEKLNVLRYSAPYWESCALTVEYYIPCPKFDSEVFFFDELFQEYNTEYNFFFFLYIFTSSRNFTIVKFYNVLQMINYCCLIILTPLFLDFFLF